MAESSRRIEPLPPVDMPSNSIDASTVSAPEIVALPQVDAPESDESLRIERLPIAESHETLRPVSTVESEGPVRYALDYRMDARRDRSEPISMPLSSWGVPTSFERYLPEYTPADPSRFLPETEARVEPTRSTPSRAADDSSGWSRLSDRQPRDVAFAAVRRQQEIEAGGAGMLEAQDEFERFVGSPPSEAVFGRLDVMSGVEGRVHEDFRQSLPQAIETIPASEIRDREGVAWTGSAYGWDAPNFFHRPLYFEETNLERYGHQYRLIQPVVSGAHFFGTLPILPYKMGSKQPNEPQYVLGHYRHGSCVPDRRERLGWSTRGALYQGLATSGVVFVIP
ncbi:MAG TPA: hypothetical protein DCQ98_20100 [Planctomycetaceae bacterium]|nr:hypothetical protein [Planctomycetaceae bacterium]